MVNSGNEITEKSLSLNVYLQLKHMNRKHKGETGLFVTVYLIYLISNAKCEGLGHVLVICLIVTLGTSVYIPLYLWYFRPLSCRQLNTNCYGDYISWTYWWAWQPVYSWRIHFQLKLFVLNEDGNITLIVTKLFYLPHLKASMKWAITLSTCQLILHMKTHTPFTVDAKNILFPPQWVEPTNTILW